LHAGDVGSAEVLEGLRAIAPVTVVRGNVDRDAWARGIPQSEVVEIEGVSIYMLHILDELDLKPGAAGFGAVVYGHTHKASSEVKDGVLYFNPGSAGPRRFKLTATVGRLIVDGKKIRGEIIGLQT
jgi:putative phosphoesterase